MELRKNPKIDLEKKRGMFLSVGLFMSLLFVFSAFEWKSYGDQIVDGFDLIDEQFDELIDIPNTVIPPPKPPKVIIPKIVVVEEEQIIEEVEVFIDTELTEELVIPELDFVEELPEVAEEILDIVETSPTPKGGMASFYKFIGKKMKYPNQARKMGIEGRVFIQFVIDKDGSITKVKTIKGIGAGCDVEAERVVALAPKWNPGKQRGNPVKVRMIVPVHFQLN